jgi:hypothetical protein
MSVFTIYCHGSGNHRDKPDKEIISFMGRRAMGQEYQDYLILDGVGGLPLSPTSTPMAGTFDWADKNRGEKGSKPKELGGSDHSHHFYSRWMPESVKQTMAFSTGHGVEDNARHAIVTIANLRNPPQTVNIIGFSRGAVTCLVIANMLYYGGEGNEETGDTLFSNIKVNIFAIEPVAGKDVGLERDNRSRIPPSVENYVALLAIGENRNYFAPQDLSRITVVSNHSNVLFLPFPGKHSTLAQNNEPSAKELQSICWTLAFRFLDHFKSLHSIKPTLLTDAAILEAYAGVVNQSEQYATIKHTGVGDRITGGGFGKREFSRHLDQYTKHSDYFINEHHRVAFKKLYPTLYGYFFGKSSQGAVSGWQPDRNSTIGQEITKAQIAGPQLTESLRPLGLESTGGGLSWGDGNSTEQSRIGAKPKA